MTRLPSPGSDDDIWGNILNDYLLISHNKDGTLKDNAVTTNSVTDTSITELKLATPVQTKLNAGIADATATSKGQIRLTGDLGGTATSPTVPGLATKANTTHSHLISEITNLQQVLDSKAATSHTHTKAQITDFEHMHAAADVTSGILDTARIPDLDAGKITTSTLSDARIPNLAISKITNLQTTLDEKAAYSHTHALSDITTNRLPLGANLNSYTTQGFYAYDWGTPGGTGSNYPNGTEEIGTLEVIVSSSSDIFQRFSNDGGYTYSRYYFDSIWSPWRGGPSDVPVGAMQMYAGNTVPPGWLLCDGTTFSATTYPALAAIIGTTYGGTSSNPATPNLNGKVPVGYSSAETEFNALGKTGGEKRHLLTAAEMPNHTHTMAHTHSINHTHPTVTSSIPNNAQTVTNIANNSTILGNSNTDLGGASYTQGRDSGRFSQDGSKYNVHTHTVEIPAFAGTSGGSSAANTGAAGSGGDHNVMQPYITLNFIIKAV